MDNQTALNLSPAPPPPPGGVSLIYQWQVSIDGGNSFTNLLNGPNSATLDLSNVTAEHNNYYYRVIATSGTTSVISQAAQLTTVPSINITTQPTNQTANTGDSATFSVQASVSSGAQTFYQWEVAQPDNPTVFESISDANSSSLILNNLDHTKNNTIYRARITAYYYTALPITVYSRTATLDMQGSSVIITQQPEDYILTDLSIPEVFTVSAISEDNTELSYQWQESFVSNGSNFTNIPFATNNTLFINNIENPSDKNQYKYRVVISNGQDTVISNAATLQTSIELSVTDSSFDNTVIWGDPHMNIASVRGALASLDDNEKEGPIVLFYLKYPNGGDSYKVVCDSKFGSGATRGPTALTDIWVEINGQKYYGAANTSDKSTPVPSSSLTLGNCTFAGVTGWDYASGRCLSFSTTAGAKNLNNTNYEQLLKNSVKWLNKNRTNPSILLFSSGRASQDINMRRVLQTITNKTISTVDINTFTNSNNILSTTNVVVLQNNYNWSTSNRMSDSAQQAIKDFVARGGGLLTSEWLIWNIAVGRFRILSDVIPVNPTSRYTSKSPIRYIQNTADSVLNAGVSSDFTFLSENIGGTETRIVSAKPGAKIFYHSEQCLPQVGSQQSIDIGNILNISYKPGSRLWANRVWYYLYIKWKQNISYSGKIRIGGAFYWIIKSLMGYKKNIRDPKYAAWRGTLRGSRVAGYDLTMRAFGISRDMLANAVAANDNSSAIAAISEEISLNDVFWKNLSKLLRGLTPDDKYFVNKNVIYFAKHPGNRTSSPNVAVSMDATAYSTNNSSISYRWQVSANAGRTFSNISTTSSLYSGVTTPTLTIRQPTTTYNDYRYRLAISSTGAVTKYSNPATLTIIPTLTISSFPTQQEAKNGQAIFSISANSTNGPLTYQWQSSSNGTTFYNISRATSSELLVNVTSYNQHNTYYRVIVRNRSETFTSNPVKLIAIPTINISSQPNDITTTSGTSISFGVTASHDNVLATSVPITYQWQYSTNNTTWISISSAGNSGSRSSQLRVPNINNSNNNYYYRVVLSVSSFSVVSRSAKLTVLPTIFSGPVSTSFRYYTTGSGRFIRGYADVSLAVSASTTIGSLTYQWQQSYRGGSYTNMSGATSSSVGVRRLSSTYARRGYYRYRVIISNGVDTITVY